MGGGSERCCSSIIDGNDSEYKICRHVSLGKTVPEMRNGGNIVDEKKQQEAYENYVKQKTPVHNLPLNMAKAFLTGGVICVIGEGILNWCEKSGIDKDISGGWVSLMLILLSVILTGFNIYPGIAKWGGAGALVPITGFANSVAAPAIEYQKEGQVMGIGCKIFTIAGPVILYGIFCLLYTSPSPRD